MAQADLFGPLTTPTSALDFKDKVKITIKSNAGVKCLTVSKPCDLVSPSGSRQELKSCDFFKISLPSPSTSLEGALANAKPYQKMSLFGLFAGRERKKREKTKPAQMKSKALMCEEGRSSTTTVHDASSHIKKEPGISDTAGGARIIKTRKGRESLSRTRGSSMDVGETQNNQNCTRNVSVHIKKKPRPAEEEPTGRMSLNIKKEPASSEDHKSFCIKEEPFPDKEDSSNVEKTKIRTPKTKEEATFIGRESCSAQAGGSSTRLSSQRKDIIVARTLPLVIRIPQPTERKVVRPKETKAGLLKKLIELGTPANENAHKTRTITSTPMKMYKCSECGRYFTSRQRLQKHHLAHKKYKVACPDCGRLFACEAAVLRHQVVHSKGNFFLCSFCEKSFSTVKAREIHQRRHTGDKPFACSECGKAFLFKEQLKTHQTIHTEERYSCNECSRCFRTEFGLVLHMKVHRGDRQYFCPECGKAFGNKCNLKLHLYIHSKVKPFVCPQCGKGFVQKYALNKHMNVHAAKEQYSCSECGKSYTRAVDYKWHMLIHLGEK